MDVNPGRCAPPVQERVERRAAFVRIELQFDPPVSPDLRPHWWGHHELAFSREDSPGEIVWNRKIEELDALPGARAWVERRSVFGWVLVLELGHEEAKQWLSRMGLPDRVKGAPS